MGLGHEQLVPYVQGGQCHGMIVDGDGGPPASGAELHTEEPERPSDRYCPSTALVLQVEGPGSGGAKSGPDQLLNGTDPLSRREDADIIAVDEQEDVVGEGRHPLQNVRHHPFCYERG